MVVPVSAFSQSEGELLPDRLVDTVSALYGSTGTDWLSRLPETIAACELRWSLRALPPLRDLSYNYVAPAVMHDGTLAILKLGVPDRGLNPEFACEAMALRRFEGRGCVRLLARDPDLGAMVLERAVPGTTLADLPDDEEATRIAARIMRRLWRPVAAEHPFPTVERWGLGFARMRERFNGGTGPLPEDTTSEAERTFADLVATSSDPVLLHGDLHHWNILRAEREPWLAIDPKGVVGEPAYEVGALLRNMVEPLMQEHDPVDVSRSRLSILADELSIERARLQGWAVAQAVLSAWWDIEDGTGDGATSIHLARIFAQADA